MGMGLGLVFYDGCKDEEAKQDVDFQGPIKYQYQCITKKLAD